MTNPQAGPGQRARTRVAQRLVAGLLAALLPGCGGGGSSDQLLAATCILMGTAESPTAKPERVTVDNAVNGLFTLFVVNLGPGTESFTYRVLITH